MSSLIILFYLRVLWVRGLDDLPLHGAGACLLLPSLCCSADWRPLIGREDSGPLCSANAWFLCCAVG